MPTKTCEHCAAAYHVKPSHAAKSRFCSYQCKKDYVASKVPSRFWAKVDRSGGPDACWAWAGVRFRDGYGQFFLNYEAPKVRAHRLSWEMANGPIPDGLQVLHRCDVRACCNPAHLFLGTHQENMADRNGKGRQARGDRSAWRTRPERMPRGERSGNAKLTEAAVRAIRAEYTGRHGQLSQLATRFGVSRTAIRFALSGRSWQHVG